MLLSKFLWSLFFFSLSPLFFHFYFILEKPSLNEQSYFCDSNSIKLARMEEKKPVNIMSRKNSVSISNGVTAFGPQQQKPIKAESSSIVKSNNTAKSGIINDNTEKPISPVKQGNYKAGKKEGKNKKHI